MRILAFSDVHRDQAACKRLVAAAGAGDLVIGAGDFAEKREGLAETMGWLAPLNGKAVYVCGNHETADELRAVTPAPVLHGEVFEIGGLTVAGIGGAVPPQPPNGWPSVDLSEAAARDLLDRIEACDILISHSPPKGVGDQHSEHGSVGSNALRAAVMRLQPQFLFCGHVHDCWGDSGMIGATRVFNLGPSVNWFEAGA